MQSLLSLVQFEHGSSPEHLTFLRLHSLQACALRNDCRVAGLRGASLIWTTTTSARREHVYSRVSYWRKADKYVQNDCGRKDGIDKVARRLRNLRASTRLEAEPRPNATSMGLDHRCVQQLSILLKPGPCQDTSIRIVQSRVL